MDIYRSMSFIISYIFILLFMVMFIPNRYTKKKSFCICSVSLLLFFLINIIRVYYFRESDFVYVIATIIQIIVIQSTCFLLSKKETARYCLPVLLPQIM